MTETPHPARAVAAIGDVADPNCWSGIPYFFWRAAKAAGFAPTPARLDLGWAVWPRRWWNAGRVLTGRRYGGFQYSPAFLAAAERRLPRELLAGEVISFSQYFPRAASVKAAGGRVSYYLDATFAALSSGRGLDLRLPPDVVRAGRELERENYALADRVITMARWTAESAVAECGVPADKVFTILPGANLDLPDGWTPAAPPGRPGVDRPFVLGFVGKDWARKGLPVVCDVRDRLAARGWRAAVRAAGYAPSALAGRAGVEFVGFIDKRDGTARFADFLAGCDVGCLFSAREALGISTLEFLRVGVPVAGYALEGPADTLPADAGFRFPASATVGETADRFDAYLRDEAAQAGFRRAAAGYSGRVTWERCVREFDTLWRTGSTAGAFRLYGAAQPGDAGGGSS
jgi:glycosyltransferase involved in cell wall biosynthesis